jgi:hypothetical protein
MEKHQQAETEQVGHGVAEEIAAQASAPPSDKSPDPSGDAGAVHIGHVLIHQEQHHGLVAPFQLLEDFQGCLARICVRHLGSIPMLETEVARSGWVESSPKALDKDI